MQKKCVGQLAVDSEKNQEIKKYMFLTIWKFELWCMVLVFNIFFQGDVECYYDAESQVIYLHLRSLSDVHRVAALCQRLVSEKSSKVGVADWYRFYVKYYIVCIFTLIILFKISCLTM